jgi:uncharacterized protein YecE (DUF72 family)
MRGEIKVGVTSWTEKTLLESGWYPKSVHTAEDRLRWYATQFPIVENDSTYYALPTERNAQLWAERTPEGFIMNLKAFATLTGHYTDPHRLPADLRDALPPALRDEPHVYPKDLGEPMVREIASRFRAGIEPLRAAGRLGLVLFQYPVWFPCSRENQRRVLETRELLPDVRIAIELRNETWMNDRHRERTLALLRDADLVYTCVDEPQGFPSSVPPIAAATSRVALVRFHGRSAARWNKATSTAAERFRYRYSERELREWTPKIRTLADRADTVHVLMNNCYSNYAVTNARQMAALLEGERSRAAGASVAP